MQELHEQRIAALEEQQQREQREQLEQRERREREAIVRRKENSSSANASPEVKQKLQVSWRKIDGIFKMTNHK